MRKYLPLRMQSILVVRKPRKIQLAYNSRRQTSSRALRNRPSELHPDLCAPIRVVCFVYIRISSIYFQGFFHTEASKSVSRRSLKDESDRYNRVRLNTQSKKKRVEASVSTYIVAHPLSHAWHTTLRMLRQRPLYQRGPLAMKKY